MPLPKNCARLADLLGDNDAEEVGEEITVEPYGFRWLRANGHH